MANITFKELKNFINKIDFDFEDEIEFSDDNFIDDDHEIFCDLKCNNYRGVFAHLENRGNDISIIFNELYFIEDEFVDVYASTIEELKNKLIEKIEHITFNFNLNKFKTSFDFGSDDDKKQLYHWCEETYNKLVKM